MRKLDPPSILAKLRSRKFERDTDQAPPSHEIVASTTDHVPAVKNYKLPSNAECEAAPPQLSQHQVTSRMQKAGAKPLVQRWGSNTKTRMHPMKGIATSLRKFMAARDEKIDKQAGTIEHLSRAERALHLADRLSKPHEVVKYISELKQDAADEKVKHRVKLGEAINFWYGPAGLEWLAFKKGMNPCAWVHYEALLDQHAMDALKKIDGVHEYRDAHYPFIGPLRDWYDY